MSTLEFLRHFAYLAMEAYFIGGVAAVLWLFHFRFLWARRWGILLATLLVSVYALPLDAWAVANGWGGFNPAYVSGIYFFSGSLLLEEIIFWLGTSFVTISAVLILAELERRGAPWWVLPAGVVLPIEWLAGPIDRHPDRAAPGRRLAGAHDSQVGRADPRHRPYRQSRQEGQRPVSPAGKTRRELRRAGRNPVRQRAG